MKVHCNKLSCNYHAGSKESVAAQRVPRAFPRMRVCCRRVPEPDALRLGRGDALGLRQPGLHGHAVRRPARRHQGAVARRRTAQEPRCACVREGAMCSRCRCLCSTWRSVAAQSQQVPSQPTRSDTSPNVSRHVFARVPALKTRRWILPWFSGGQDASCPCSPRVLLVSRVRPTVSRDSTTESLSSRQLNIFDPFTSLLVCEFSPLVYHRDFEFA